MNRDVCEHFNPVDQPCSKCDLPLALFLAQELDAPIGTQSTALTMKEAATELRRLHAENEAMKAELLEQARVNGMGGEREARLMALNAELVEALRRCRDMVGHLDNLAFIDAALAKAGESK